MKMGKKKVEQKKMKMNIIKINMKMKMKMIIMKKNVKMKMKMMLMMKQWIKMK